MDEELSAWMRTWQHQPPSLDTIAPRVHRARRESRLQLGIGWGVVALIAVFGGHTAFRVSSPLLAVFFALLCLWAAAVMVRLTRRDRADRSADLLGVRQALTELRHRTARELSPPWRFWTLNLLLEAAMLWLPWQLWLEGTWYPDEPTRALTSVAFFNLVALGILFTQIRERHQLQDRLATLTALARELEDPVPAE